MIVNINDLIQDSLADIFEDIGLKNTQFSIEYKDGEIKVKSSYESSMDKNKISTNNAVCKVLKIKENDILNKIFKHINEKYCRIIDFLPERRPLLVEVSDTKNFDNSNLYLYTVDDFYEKVFEPYRYLYEKYL